MSNPDPFADAVTGWANTVWFDPGGTTGWSVFMVHPESLSDPDVSVLENIHHWAQGQITGDEINQVNEMVELVNAWPDAAIGIENFRLRTRRSSEETLSPVRITAMFRWAVLVGHTHPGEKRCGKVPGRRIHLQMPSLAMTTVTDDRLKEWGFYLSDGEEHARDATRHALTFLKRSKESSKQLRKLAWPDLYDEE